MMTKRTICAVLLLACIGIGLNAQDGGITAKITDLEKETTTVKNTSSSSSSSCNTADFPVYQGTTQEGIDFADLTWISVRHDLTPSDPNYIKLEIDFKNGTSGIYEAVRYMRITGTSEEGNVGIMLKDINTIEIVQKN
jgi:hypothetical protein